MRAPSTLDTRPSTHSSGYRRKYLEQELLEVSAVGIPANPDALQLGLKAGAIEKADLQDLLELLRGPCEADTASSPLPSPPEEERERKESFCSDKAAPETDTGALGGGSDEAQWLQLARAVRDALKH